MATGCQRQQHGEDDDVSNESSFNMAALDQFDYIRFTTTDMNGIGRGVSVPRRHAGHCLHEGLGFYAGRVYLCYSRRAFKRSLEP